MEKIMQASLEQVTEIIRALPLEDFDKVREMLDREEQERKGRGGNEKNELQRRMEKFKKAEKWLAENREKYLNEWVCLDGDRLVAHGADGKKVFQQAKEAGIKSPYLVRVVEEPEAFSGAWL